MFLQGVTAFAKTFSSEGFLEMAKTLLFMNGIQPTTMSELATSFTVVKGLSALGFNKWPLSTDP
jgi:hypothetical protein